VNIPILWVVRYTNGNHNTKKYLSQATREKIIILVFSINVLHFGSLNYHTERYNKGKQANKQASKQTNKQNKAEKKTKEQRLFDPPFSHERR